MKAVEEVAGGRRGWRTGQEHQLRRGDSNEAERTHLVVSVLQHRNLPLIQMHRRLLPLHRLQYSPHLLTRRLAPQQKPPTPLEGGAEVVDVGTGEIVEENFEDVEDGMDGRDAEFGEFGEEAEVLREGREASAVGEGRRAEQTDLGASLGHVGVLLALEVAELIFEL